MPTSRSSQRCSFCFFYLHRNEPGVVDAYLDSLAAELQLGRAAHGTRIDAIFVGAVKLSVVAPDGALTLEEIHQAFNVAADAETTISGIRGTMTSSASRRRAAGNVNRLNIGAQALDERRVGV